MRDFNQNMGKTSHHHSADVKTIASSFHSSYLHFRLSRPTASAPSLRRVVLERVDTTLNAVDQKVARVEVRVDGPRAVEGNLTTDLVVLRADVEVGNLLELGARVVVGDGRDVDHAETGTGKEVSMLLFQELEVYKWKRTHP